MRNIAIMVDSRPTYKDIAEEIIKRHLKYLPKWDSVFIDNFPDESYNHLMTRKSFWEEYIDYNRILIIQHDSGILRFGIEEFMMYDYVGAPFKWLERGGNGGLSLRNPKAMIDVLNQHEWNSKLGYAEDWFYSKHVKNIAPREVCFKFSVEAIFQLGSFGYHAIERYLPKEEVDLILNQYK